MEGLARNSRRGASFVKHIWTTLFVGLTIGELYCLESMPFIEAPRANIRLKHVEPDRWRGRAQNVGKQCGADTLAYSRRGNVHLVDPAVFSIVRDSH